MTKALVCLPLKNLNDWRYWYNGRRYGRKGGAPQTPMWKQEQAMLAIAKGATMKEAADQVGVCRETVKAIKRRHPERLKELREAVSEAALNEIHRDNFSMIRSLRDAASNPEIRHQAQAARVLGEYAGSIGKQSIHIGDTHVHGNVDLSQNLTLGEGDMARLEELRRRHGVAGS